MALSELTTKEYDFAGKENVDCPQLYSLQKVVWWLSSWLQSWWLWLWLWSWLWWRDMMISTSEDMRSWAPSSPRPFTLLSFFSSSWENLNFTLHICHKRTHTINHQKASFRISNLLYNLSVILSTPGQRQQLRRIQLEKLTIFFLKNGQNFNFHWLSHLTQSVWMLEPSRTSLSFHPCHDDPRLDNISNHLTLTLTKTLTLTLTLTTTYLKNVKNPCLGSTNYLTISRLRVSCPTRLYFIVQRNVA